MKKKKKNKHKGFSLIELIAVVMIIGILLVIAIPQVYKYVNKGKKDYYAKLENNISAAAANYFEDYRALLPREIGHVNEINVEELVQSKYIDTLKDEKGNSCTGKVITEKVKKDSYEYYACIECGKYYSTINKNCNKSVNDNIYADSDLYYLTADKEEYEVKQMTTFSSLEPHVKVYKRISDTESIPVLADDEYLEGTPSKLKVTDLTTKNILYTYHGAKLTVTVKGIDETPPAVSVNLTKVKDKKKYNGKWYSGDILATFKATDFSGKGISGSGIDYYEVSDDGITFTPITGNKQKLTVEGEYTKYVRAVDKNGNISEAVAYTVKIDKTAPTCTWSGESTEWQPNLNLPLNQRVDSRTIVATCSDSTSDCTNETKVKEWLFTETIKTKKLSYKMHDLAGNLIDCNKEANIYLDKDAPILTGTNPLTIGTQDYEFTTNINVVDEHSGVNESLTYCDPATSRKTGIYTVVCYATDNNGNQGQFSFEVKHSITVPGNTQTNALCGTEQCNPHETCAGGFNELQCSCADNEGDSAHCTVQVGGCWYICSRWETEYDTCTKSCTIYTCPAGTRHSDGSIQSRTDPICWYY